MRDYLVFSKRKFAYLQLQFKNIFYYITKDIVDKMSHQENPLAEDNSSSKNVDQFQQLSTELQSRQVEEPLDKAEQIHHNELSQEMAQIIPNEQTYGNYWMNQSRPPEVARSSQNNYQNTNQETLVSLQAQNAPIDEQENAQNPSEIREIRINEDLPTHRHDNDERTLNPQPQKKLEPSSSAFPKQDIISPAQKASEKEITEDIKNQERDRDNFIKIQDRDLIKEPSPAETGNKQYQLPENQRENHQENPHAQKSALQETTNKVVQESQISQYVVQKPSQLGDVVEPTLQVSHQKGLSYKNQTKHENLQPKIIVSHEPSEVALQQNDEPKINKDVYLREQTEQKDNLNIEASKAVRIQVSQRIPQDRPKNQVRISINSVRQKPTVEKKNQGRPSNCACEIM